MMWPTRTAFAELQDAERSPRRTAADKPKRVQVSVFDLETHANWPGRKWAVPIRIPGNKPRNFVAHERVAVVRREIGQWSSVGVLDLNPNMSAGTSQVVDLQPSTGTLQWTRGEVSTSLASAEGHKAIHAVRETP